MIKAVTEGGTHSAKRPVTMEKSHGEDGKGGGGGEGEDDDDAAASWVAFVEEEEGEWGGEEWEKEECEHATERNMHG
jgi:hypothetical protein